MVKKQIVTGKSPYGMPPKKIKARPSSGSSTKSKTYPAAYDTPPLPRKRPEKVTSESKPTKRYLGGDYAGSGAMTPAKRKAAEPQLKQYAKQFKTPRKTKKGNVYTGGGF